MPMTCFNYECSRVRASDGPLCCFLLDPQDCLARDRSTCGLTGLVTRELYRVLCALLTVRSAAEGPSTDGAARRVDSHLGPSGSEESVDEELYQV